MAGVVTQDEVSVGGQDDAVQLEREPAGIVTGRKLVLLDGGGCEATEQAHEPGLEVSDGLLDRAGTGAHLQHRPGEETSAGEGAALQVLEECLAHGLELGQAGGSRQGGPDDFVGEDTPRLFHGGQLKILLRAEVSVQAASTQGVQHAAWSLGQVFGIREDQVHVPGNSSGLESDQAERLVQNP